MSRRSHKVQVTLDEVEYAAIRRQAEAEGRKHAAVVREAIRRYCVEPDKRRRQREALATIAALPPAPVPSSWPDWKRDYAAMKAAPLPDERRSPEESGPPRPTGPPGRDRAT
jgi:ferritin-like protein